MRSLKSLWKQRSTRNLIYFTRWKRHFSFGLCVDADQTPVVILIFADEFHQQVMFPLGVLHLQAKHFNIRCLDSLTRSGQLQGPERSAYLSGELALAVGRRGGVESVHLPHLLLPHPAQGVRGDVEVGQLLEEDGEKVIVSHLDWREEITSTVILVVNFRTRGLTAGSWTVDRPQ